MQQGDLLSFRKTEIINIKPSVEQRNTNRPEICQMLLGKNVKQQKG